MFPDYDMDVFDDAKDFQTTKRTFQHRILLIGEYIGAENSSEMMSTTKG